MTSRAKTFVAVLVGMLLLQAAWILVVPAFRGLDEHDHAYKAAAVARGDWSPHHQVVPGEWGDVLAVPRDLVLAAHRVCDWYDYTSDANCNPGKSLPAGQVEVTSSAARYNPAFYFVIGTAARPFHGDEALYAMRAAAAVMCALMIALAAATLRGRDGAGRWAVVGLVAATTPIVVYSTSVAAPNGIEMASAAVVWAAASRLAGQPPDTAETRGLIAALAAGAVPLATVRTLGPLWLALILAVVIVAFGTAHLRSLVRRADARIAGAAVLLAVAAGIAWSLTASTNAPPSSGEPMPHYPWTHAPVQVVLWLLQSIGTFPARTEPAPAVVYAVVLVGWSILVSVALRRTHSRLRAAIVLVVAIAVLLPGAVTIATYDAAGLSWQGRYTYPFTMGVLLLAGLALDQAQVGGPRTARLVGALSIVGIAISELASQLRVLKAAPPTRSLIESLGWALPPAVTVGLLTIAGAIGLGGAILCTTANDSPEDRADRTVQRDGPEARVGA